MAIQEITTRKEDQIQEHSDRADGFAATQYWLSIINNLKSRKRTRL